MANKNIYDLSDREVQGRYYMRLEGVTEADWVSALSMLLDTDQDTEKYRWLGAAPAMREVLGERKYAQLRAQGLSISGILYQAGLEIEKNLWRRDKTGQLDIRLDDLAKREVQHWRKLLSDLINNGAATACYDGQFFFDTDHDEGDSGEQSNDLSSSDYGVLECVDGTQPTADEMAKAILYTVMHFYTLKDDQGEPINEDALNFTVQAGANPIGVAAVEAVSENHLDTGSGTRDNPLKNKKFTISAEINPRITSTAAFYTFRTDAATKPFIRQPEPQSREMWVLGPNSEHWKKEGCALANIEENRGSGYAFWQYAIMSTLSTEA